MTNGKDIAALILRVGFGGLMLFGHGRGKLKMLMAGGDIQFPGVLGLSPQISLILAVVAEFLCAALIILGLKTKWVVWPLLITMAVAAFVIHKADPLFSQGGASKEFALLYLLPCLALFFLGSGKYSLDHILKK